jgi:hypothetical protein
MSVTVLVTNALTEKAWIGVETALSGRPSLRTVRAVFPHTALQLLVPVLGVEILGVGLFE